MTYGVNSPTNERAESTGKVSIEFSPNAVRSRWGPFPASDQRFLGAFSGPSEVGNICSERGTGNPDIDLSILGELQDRFPIVGIDFIEPAAAFEDQSLSLDLPGRTGGISGRSRSGEIRI